MPTFQGFSGEQDAILLRAHVKAIECIKSALRSMSESTTAYTIRYEKYFGSASWGSGSWGSDGSTFVNTAISSIFVAMQENKYTVRNGGEHATTRASMIHGTAEFDRGGMTMGGVSMTVIEGTDKGIAMGVNFDMTIYSPYWAMDFHKVDFQSQLQIYIHELSHFAAGTIDTDLSTGGKAYGFYGAMQCKHEGNGPWNAENVGMFLASFYSG